MDSQVIYTQGLIDLSRISEIYVFNNRINYWPIFKDNEFSFGELQVVTMVDNYFGKDEILKNILVYDDGLIKGFIQMNGTEICKIYISAILDKSFSVAFLIFNLLIPYEILIYTIF